MNSPESVDPVPSPCTGVCRMDEATGWCRGCRRTLQEIARWSAMTPADKRAVWAALPLRQISPGKDPGLE